MRAHWERLALGCLLSAAVLVGCSSRPAPVRTTAAEPPATPAAATAASPTAAVPDDAAVMTVYRKKRIVGLALNTSVHVDGTEVAELDPGTYVRVRLAPGAHRVWADVDDDALAVEARPGQTHYFRMELVAGLWKGHGVLVAVDETTAARELEECACTVADQIKVPSLTLP